ncbi:helix-turn-helix transcriptional regulator [Staphylococcus simulans]|uniref:helix-turn-helix transcriptional regulator n=1 Tax=Staphylococcus simulans TaxID=1286 RepID=UPI0021D2BC42|nr:helix-turn-helix transcriptional regulator [Staphylococcus simulans]UXV38789.1 helix-turn-helix transcriptional regulator [Staphylococcus simulans]UXV41211.1 helix-turn-helix transcriptional regulator [Staphylococcus simulans]
MNLKFKVARVSMNLTQKELANKVEVSRQTISLIEKNDYNPSLMLCKKICKQLDKSLDEIFGDE